MKQTGSFNDTTKLRDKDDIDIHSCASTDCTGLIPSMPLSEAEMEAYNELYRYLPEAKKIT